MTFDKSSQALKFLFNKETLAGKRHEAYEATRASFAVQLTEDEHQRYIAYYGDVLLHNSRKLGFNRYQRFTALALMQRVYLSRTLWDIPPALAMISCLFLVAKFVRPEALSEVLSRLGYGIDFSEKFRPEEQVAKIEIAVLTALDFKLKIHLPFHETIALCDGQPFSDRAEECQQRLFDILRTDALLLHPPGQLALAAVSSVVGIDTALTSLGDVPEIERLREEVEEILNLPVIEVNPSEIEEMDQRISKEFAVFHVIEKEKSIEAKTSSPTAMLPP
jgi:hypothetical protein